MENKTYNKLTKIFTVLFILVVGVPSVYKLGKMTGQFFGWIDADPNHAYLEEIQPIANKSAEVLNGIAPLFDKNDQLTQEDILGKIKKARDEMQTLNNETDAIKAPAEYNDIHREFTGSMRLYLSAFNLLTEGMETGQEAKLQEASGLLVQGGNRMNKVSQDILARAKKE